MSTLASIAELVCRQFNPNPTPAQIAEYVARAKVEYPAAMWIFAKEEEASTGFFELPGELLTEIELDVVNNEIDISELDILNAFSGNRWLQNIGGMGCECKYIISTVNQEKALCDDDSLPESTRTVVIVGKKLKFPKGTHADKLKITYANKGIDLDANEVIVNEYVASKVSDRLMAIYGQKYPADQTINNNPNN